MDNSLFRIYSLGIVAKDIEVGSSVIETYLKERMGRFDGDINEVEPISTTNVDSNGNTKVINIDNTPLTSATWLGGFDTNRVTRPDVRAGEQVVIYRYADTDKYYWVDVFTELDLRRKEEVTYVFVNTDDKSETVIDETNSYFITISTQNKRILISTADNDEEACAYKIELDTKEGQLSISDSLDNSILLNSPEGSLTTNINELIETTTKVLTTTAETSITETTADKTVNVDNALILNVEASMKVNSPKFEIQGSADGLLALLVELIDAAAAVQHIGNLGAPTSIMPPSKAVYDDIKARLSEFL